MKILNIYPLVICGNRVKEFLKFCFKKYAERGKYILIRFKDYLLIVENMFPTVYICYIKKLSESEKNKKFEYIVDFIEGIVFKDPISFFKPIGKEILNDIEHKLIIKEIYKYLDKKMLDFDINEDEFYLVPKSVYVASGEKIMFKITNFYIFLKSKENLDKYLKFFKDFKIIKEGKYKAIIEPKVEWYMYPTIIFIFLFCLWFIGILFPFSWFSWVPGIHIICMFMWVIVPILVIILPKLSYHVIEKRKEELLNRFKEFLTYYQHQGIK